MSWLRIAADLLRDAMSPSSEPSESVQEVPPPADISGVIGILKPGHRVDIQLVSNQSPELRTILQNIEVLSVNPQGDGHGNIPVVTLLVKPEGADMAGLGDSTARLRVILRNPLDEGSSELGTVTLPGLLSHGAKKK